MRSLLLARVCVQVQMQRKIVDVAKRVLRSEGRIIEAVEDAVASSRLVSGMADLLRAI